MGEKKRDTTGRYSRSVDDTDVVAAVRAHDPAATSEIADEVGISRQGADRRLRDLRERGEVSSKKIGASLVWFMPRDRGQQTPREPRDSAESVTDRDTDQSPADTPTTPRAATENHRELLVETLPGEGGILDRRADVVMQMYEAIRDADGSVVKTGELKELVDAEAVGYDSVGSFWTNAVKKNSTQNRPNSLTHLPDVEDIGNGRYRYTGGDR